MSTYLYTSQFGQRDSLPVGAAQKIIRGVEYDTEFNAISSTFVGKVDRPTSGTGSLAILVNTTEGIGIGPWSVPLTDLVTLTGTQTLTGKTLISPTMTDPVLTDVTVTGGTITDVTFINPTLASVTLTDATIITPTIDSPTFSGAASFATPADRDGYINLFGAMGEIFARFSNNPVFFIPDAYTTISWNDFEVFGPTVHGDTIGPNFTGTIPRGARIVQIDADIPPASGFGSIDWAFEVAGLATVFSTDVGYSYTANIPEVAWGAVMALKFRGNQGISASSSASLNFK